MPKITFTVSDEEWSAIKNKIGIEDTTQADETFAFKKRLFKTVGLPKPMSPKEKRRLRDIDKREQKTREKLETINHERNNWRNDNDAPILPPSSSNIKSRSNFSHMKIPNPRIDHHE